MEAVSRPSPEPLAERPAEEPTVDDTSFGARARNSEQPAASAMPMKDAPTDEVDPELLLSSAESPSVKSPQPPKAASSAPAMDRDFIARNQIVERYLSGRLPLKGATDFERFCRDNPKLLDELGVAERVNAGLRLLESSGKPEPWQEAPRRSWAKPQVILTLAGLVLILLVALTWVTNSKTALTQKVQKLQKQVVEQPLDPATSTQAIRLVPSRDGASNTPAFVIGPGPAQLVDLKIDESRSAYKVFRVTIDRIDQGRVAVLHNLIKDSNGHLRVALNSTALGQGNYQLTIEGLSWRGDPEPDSWITIGIQR